MPTRKVDIRTRMEQLDQAVLRRKTTVVAQHDERVQLVEDCRSNGDHVFEFTFMNFDLVELCEFCRLPKGASKEQIARNIVRA